MKRQGIRRASVVFGALLVGVGCSEQSVTNMNSFSSRKVSAAQKSDKSISGDVTYKFKVYELGGGVKEVTGVGRVDGPSVPTASSRPTFVLRDQSEPRNEARPAPGSSPLPSFAFSATPAERSGAGGGLFAVPSFRVRSARVDGHMVEQYMVREGGKASGKPVGMMIRIDGRLRHVAEFTTRAGRSLPTEVRMVQIDTAGRVSSDYSIDLSRVSETSRLAASEQSGLQTMFRRLVRGGANLVLPDALYAQAQEDNPCQDLQSNFDNALGVFAAAVVTSFAAVAACAVTVISCPAVPFTLAAVAIAAAVAASAADDLNHCEALHPPCIEGGYMTNGSCASPVGGGTTGGGGPGGGGGGATGGGGAGTNGGSGGSVTCNWRTGWYYDEFGFPYVSYPYLECI